MNNRTNLNQALKLYDSFDMNYISGLASDIRQRLNGNNVYYNNNFHIEPSNICRHRCKFCSYRRDDSLQPGAWSMSLDEVRSYCRQKYRKGTTEVHVVGSVYPEKGLDYYVSIIKIIREELPGEITIKAYSAVEIDDMSKYSEKSHEEVLTILKNAGVEALPGGGAEIFEPRVREQICPDKADAKTWLNIHRLAHKTGIRTNCTMLFGHIESREERVKHLLALRELQDETNGFDAFIPLLFKSNNNSLSYLGELDIIEILKTFAVSRIVLDNIPHIKSYWPMLGKELCQLSLLYGADDIDGTINDSTKIYSMAGSMEKNPGMTSSELRRMATACGYNAIERDSFYNEISKK
ncbi:MAG: CofH family radical SAM protein [Bacteroidales bacterium]